MLNTLSIKNIVLVESLDLNLGQGLNILTGETGAGKSILLDALGLVIGGRGDSSLVRNGTEKGVVIATFTIRTSHPVWSILELLDIEYEIGEDLILKRTISKDGKSRATINGTPLPIKELRLVGNALVDVQGQFDQHGLLSPLNHMDILDDFAGTTHARNALNDLYTAWKNTQKVYDDALDEYNSAKEESEYITYCLAELEELNPQAGEEQELLETKAKLQNSNKLLQALQSTNTLLGGDNGADTQIRKTERILEGISSVGGESIETIIRNLAEVSSTLQDIMTEVQDQAYEVQSGAFDFATIEDRLYNLKELARKHRCSIDDLENIMNVMREKNTLLQDVDGTLEKLQNNIHIAKKKYTNHAISLSEKRHRGATALSQKVCNEIPHLGLSGAEFMVHIETTDTIDLDRVSKNGMNTIRFMARMNAGTSHNPIHKSASGGELSRMLLAINVALAEKNTATTLMFDEVDAGVGGKSADSIGSRLQILSKTHQVFVITHSPQVAGSGDNHLFVSKSEVNAKTVSNIKELSYNERIQEIGRMLSGENITDIALDNAKVLLEKSRVV